MDNKQAASTLREIYVHEQCEQEAINQGADAIEMLEWLFSKRDLSFNICWCIHDWVEDQDFRAFCEARFRERAR